MRTFPNIVGRIGRFAALAGLVGLVGLVPCAAQTTGAAADVTIAFADGREGLRANVAVASTGDHVVYGDLIVMKNGAMIRRVPIQTSTRQAVEVSLGDGLQLVTVQAVFSGSAVLPGQGGVAVREEARATYRQQGVARPALVGASVLQRRTRTALTLSGVERCGAEFARGGRP